MKLPARRALPLPDKVWPWSWPWPLPAIATWCAAWLGFAVQSWLQAPAAWCLIGAAGLGGALATRCQGPWRCLIAALGFPLSAWALGAAAAWPAWGWLVLLLPLLMAYPLRAWRDAPFFPTPAAALDGLPAIVGDPRQVLDAGCGLGHGLRALRRQWPSARLQGVEWSPLLALAALCWCPWALIRRGDMWAGSWAEADLVYVFQRPESMPRAWDKARAEMRPGSWLVSLEFAVPGVVAVANLQRPGQRPVWIYQPNSPMPSNPRSTGAWVSR